MRVLKLITLLTTLCALNADFGEGALPSQDNEHYQERRSSNHIQPGMGPRPPLYLQPRPRLGGDSMGLTPRPYRQSDQEQNEGFLVEPDQYFRSFYNNEYRDWYKLDDNNRNYFPYRSRRNSPGFSYRSRNRGRFQYKRFSRFDYMNYL